ncbi:MAG TPA: ECF-type sigma factor [Pirellulales bacterium]|nr:ECF-type sigma factor [Pirellulales bacterium]
MSEVTQILNAIESGEPRAAKELLPLVYDELRKLAAARLAQEKPGQTLDATALIHEAYLRLVGNGDAPQWDHRGHFFAAAAEAVRRILVDRARRKQSVKHGGMRVRQELEEACLMAPEPSEDFVALSDALDRLSSTDPQASELVKLRYFAGLTSSDAAAAMGISPRTADRLWVYARSFLLRELEGS